MKTAISLSDMLFHKAERCAKRQGKSRSQLYAEALAEYVARHSPEEITDTANDICERLGQPDQSLVSAAARRLLKKETW
ncbi:MAG TPA: hypothetical protein VGG19_08820 [Tepidisphaeraceae bacterium]|jgi:metal-responsive CopG/Arc/MetJ family transcriptional regulator